MQRGGLQIRGDRGNPQSRAAFVRFARWLRQEYNFSLRVPVYPSPAESVATLDGKKCSASVFFAPWDCAVDAFARIATSCYRKLRLVFAIFVAYGSACFPQDLAKTRRDGCLEPLGLEHKLADLPTNFDKSAAQLCTK